MLPWGRIRNVTIGNLNFKLLKSIEYSLLYYVSIYVFIILKKIKYNTTASKF